MMASVEQEIKKARRETEVEQNLTCSICQKDLPRSKFSKKTIKKGETLCQLCRNAVTAARCKQPAPKQVQDGRRSESGIQRRPNNWGYCDYVDKLFSLDCFHDLVRLQVFTSAKDVSESMAALQATRDIVNDDTICLCIGDGSTPRTAVLACYLRPWTSVVSIDPALKAEWVGYEPNGVRNLTCFAGTLLSFMENLRTDNRSQVLGKLGPAKQLVILLVHSHARFIGDCSIRSVRVQFGSPPTTIVSLPCCTRFRHTEDLHFAPTIQYDDDCVFSACRTVQIWKYDDKGDIVDGILNSDFCQVTS